MFAKIVILVVMRIARRLIVFVALIGVVGLSVYGVGQVVRFYGEAEGIEANLLVDASVSYEPISSVWRNLAQGGEESGVRMLEPVVGDMKSLGPRYIRLDHIYDYYNVVSRGSSGNLSFNWASLDATISDILAAGAKPFFALSYMPSAISSGDIVGKPVNWSDWQQVVKETVEHYSGTGGMAINDVYYEVWNEPDLFGGYKTYGDKNYLDLYLYSARGAENSKNFFSF